VVAGLKLTPFFAILSRLLRDKCACFASLRFNMPNRFSRLQIRNKFFQEPDFGNLQEANSWQPCCMAKSFYNLDYLIEISEKRLEEYTASYQKVFDGITNIILIYSILGIFLTAFVRHVIEADIAGWMYYICFALFSISFIISISYFVRLLLPVKVAYLDPPKKYYDWYKPKMEAVYPGVANRQKVDDSLKGSYILEIDMAIRHNIQVLKRKRSFYYNALLFGLLAIVPYVICLAYHLGHKEDDVHKVQLISSKVINFKQ
jgi:hypothetical protein